MSDLWGLHTAADEWTPPSSSTLPSVGHCGNNEWGEGLCGHLAIAFKNMYPDMKIGAEYDPRWNSVNHAWAYGPDGRSHDFMGTHDGHPFQIDQGSEIREDVDPEDLAADMRIDYNPHDDRQWENPEIAQAGHLINRHWLGDDDYDGDDGYYDPARAENRGHRTASTGGIRYAHVVEADVAEDLRRVAMPAIDAYDNYDSEDEGIEVPRDERVDHQDIKPGPYFHATYHNFQPGDILLPRRDLGDEAGGRVGWSGTNRENWVWMSKHPAEAHFHVFDDPEANVYEIEPLDEGPWKWNKHPAWDGTDDGGDKYVSPRARIVRKIEPDENGEYFNWTPSRTARLAAFNEDLVDRLKDEFHAWRKQQPKGSIFGGGIIGGLDHWPNIEKFLKDRYPAVHRGFDMGYEQARVLMDWDKEQPGDSLSGLLPYGKPSPFYETGPDAVSKHGYDPKEIAAGMLLLHNKSDRFRGDMSQEDQARLTDIAQNRQQSLQDVFDRHEPIRGDMPQSDVDTLHGIAQTRHRQQQVYDQRNARLAMPSRDAYDDMVMDFKRKTDDIPEQGEFFHGSDHEHQPGDILESVRARGDQDRLDYYERSVGAPNHADWVWMYNHPAKATKFHKNVYQLEPLDEGPWIWNNYKRDDGSFSPGENDADFPRLVSPRARVIRKLSPEEYAAASAHLEDYYNQYRQAHRLAMPAPLPQGVYFRYHPELTWSPGVTAHLPGGKQVGSLEWYDDDHVMVDLAGRRPGEIDQIAVHPDHQGQSIATSMFDFAKQHEPRLHHSDRLTDDGRGWSAYEQSRNARLAMAWQDWAPKIKANLGAYTKGPLCGTGECSYANSHAVYTIDHDNGTQSHLSFSHHKNRSGKPFLRIVGLYTQPQYKKDGVAESFMRRLMQDHPDAAIDPGDMTQQGQGFHDRMLEKEPDARNVVTAGKNGDLPENLTFRHRPAGSGSFPDVIQPTISVSGSFPTVTAHDGDRMVGYLQWHDDHPRKKGEIWDLRVHPDYQRRGVATALFDWTTDQIDPDLHHSNNLSDEGRAFAESEVARPLAEQRDQAWRRGEPMPKRFAGRNGDPPPMTFEPFNTMWSNGIMARHAADGRPLAHLHWYPDGEIETIRVHPELRGRGIGKAILVHAATHPETYEASGGIKPSNHLTADGRAFARSMGHNPDDSEVTPAEGEHDWAWRAVDQYVPMHIPYTGQNEDEMSHHLEQPWTPPNQKTASADDGWPVWWRGRHRPGVEFDKRWHPNHPEHIPAPWES